MAQVTAIQPADPRARRRYVALVLMCVLLGVAVILIWQHGQSGFVIWLLAEPEQLTI